MSLKDEGVDATMFLCSSGETKFGTAVMMSVESEDIVITGEHSQGYISIYTSTRSST